MREEISCRVARAAHWLAAKRALQRASLLVNTVIVSTTPIGSIADVFPHAGWGLGPSVILAPKGIGKTPDLTDTDLRLGKKQC